MTELIDIECYNKDMKNTHLEHPEDAVLLGRESTCQVLDFLKEKNSKVSVKWDGAPAFVFGHNPENGKRFVGTKSVFNKRKIKINHNHHEIEENHGDNPRVAAILHTCLECLPDRAGVWQGDFIGYGGTDKFTPNTITYQFDEKVEDSIVVAVHTSYTGNKLSEMQASFTSKFDHWSIDKKVKYLNTDAKITSRRRRVDYLINLAGLMANVARFPSDKRATEIKVEINRCIREQRDISVKMCPILLSLYKLIAHIKEILMEGIESTEAVSCYIGSEPSDHEGYVMTNEHGTYKLVNRRQFSYANFTLQKEWNK